MPIPLLKRKEGQWQPKCHQGIKILLYLPTFCLKNVSFIGPINCSVPGHLLEWIWLFDFDIQNKIWSAILLILHVMISLNKMWYHKRDFVMSQNDRNFYFKILFCDFTNLISKMDPYCYITNIKSEMRSFKSNENIHKEEGSFCEYIKWIFG